MGIKNELIREIVLMIERYNLSNDSINKLTPLSIKNLKNYIIELEGKNGN
jgi:hypothetical protein